MKFGALRGRQATAGRRENYNLEVLGILAERKGLTLEKLTDEVAKIEVKRTGLNLFNQSQILQSALSKRQGLEKLLQNEYVKRDLFDEQKLEITLKGIYIVLSHIDELIRIGDSIIVRNISINIDFNSNLINTPPFEYFLIEDIDVLSQLQEFIRSLIPIKPILLLWREEIEDKYNGKDFDDLSLMQIERDFYTVIEKTLTGLTHMMIKQGLITAFFTETDINSLKERILEWIDSNNEDGAISEKLLRDRLASEKKITNFEARIISITKSLYKADGLRVFLSPAFFPNGPLSNTMRIRSLKGRKLKNIHVNYNLDILRTLAEKGSLTLTKLADASKVSKDRLSDRKSGRLKDLHSKEYINWRGFDKKFDRRPIDITLKGLLAVFCSSVISEWRQYSNSIKLDPTLIKDPTYHLPVGETLMDSDYFKLFVKMLIPQKPIIYFWMENIATSYINKDLDDIPLSFIVQKFYVMAETVVNVIISLMIEDKVLAPYFSSDLKTDIRKFTKWINDHEQTGELSRELLKNGCRKRKNLTNFEKRIINIYEQWFIQYTSLANSQISNNQELTEEIKIPLQAYERAHKGFHLTSEIDTRTKG